MVEFVFGVYNYVTFQRSASVTFGRLDGVQFESLCFRVVFKRRNTPLQAQVFRHFSLNFRHGEVFVDISGILVVCITYNRALTAGIYLKNCQQRMFFLDLLKVGSLCFAFTFQCCGKAVGSAGSLRYGGSFGSYAVCCFCCVFCGSQDCTQFGISRLQVRSNVFCVVCFPEFQVGRTL